MNKYVAVFDLDGVLADFDGEFKRISGLDWGNFSDNTPVDLSKTKKWALIKAQPSFFGILPWVLGAKILWEHINTICSTFILSAASENVPSSKQEKIDWCKEQLKFTDYDISIRCWIVNNRKDKASYCKILLHAGFTPILIDDHPENIKEWIAVGGIGIPFVNSNQALQEFHQIVGGE